MPTNFISIQRLAGTRKKVSGATTKMTDEEFTVDFPSEVVKEGKVKALVPKLKAFVKQSSDYAPS